VERSVTLNFSLVKDLCGEAFPKNVTIVTANRHQGTPSENFEEREEQLRTASDYYSGLIKNGARLHRCGSAASISDLLSELSSQEAIPLGIQTEAKRQLSMTETAMGATLRARLHQSIEETHKEEEQEMR
jgi:hypothetical protein